MQTFKTLLWFDRTAKLVTNETGATDEALQ